MSFDGGLGSVSHMEHEWAQVSIDVLILGEDGLVLDELLCTVDRLHFTPHELAAHAVLDDRLERKAQGIKVFRLHKGPQDAGRVLEVLLRLMRRTETLRPWHR